MTLLRNLILSSLLMIPVLILSLNAAPRTTPATELFQVPSPRPSINLTAPDEMIGSYIDEEVTIFSLAVQRNREAIEAAPKSVYGVPAWQIVLIANDLHNNDIEFTTGIHEASGRPYIVLLGHVILGV